MYNYPYVYASLGAGTDTGCSKIKIMRTIETYMPINTSEVMPELILFSTYR